MRRIKVALDSPVSVFENGDYIVMTLNNPTATSSSGRLYKSDGHLFFIHSIERMNGDRPNDFNAWFNNTNYTKSWCCVGDFRTVLDVLVWLEESSRTITGHPLNPIISERCLLLSDAVVKDTPKKFIHPKYETTSIYTGRQGYHSHHGGYYNKPKKNDNGYKIGVELEVEARTAENYRKITELKSNWLQMEADGSLGSYGIEFITIPMKPQDIKEVSMWQDLCEYLSPIARSWDNGRCGLHVHIGREILGNTPEQQSETIGKMLYLYHHFLKEKELNIKIYGREHAYNDRDGKSAAGVHVAALGSELMKIKSIKEKVDRELKERAGTARYFDINLLNSATVEFRKGRGSINAERIVSVITYSEFIAKYAKQAKWEKISYTDFFEYVREKVKKDSPLRKYFYTQE